MQVCSAERLTDAYHQTILGFGEEYCNQVAWDVSQYTLRRLWDNNCTTAPNQVGENNANTMRAATYTSTESAAESTLLCCQGCGFRLHPGWKGTNIRIKRPTPPPSASAKRTLRRREQRKQRKVARSEERKAAEYSNKRRTAFASTGGPVLPCHDKRIILCDDPSIGRLDRNRLVITCGRCGEKVYRKGLRRKPQGPRAEDTKSASLSLATSQAKKGELRDRAVGSFGQDFEPVPKYKRKSVPKVAAAATSNSASSNTKRSAAPISLLQQKMGRKKKKRPAVPDRKPGNIHSFLSSLNDN